MKEVKVFRSKDAQFFKKKEHLKPKECCEVGSYEHQISMPLNGRRQGIDLCISDIIAALNAANIKTISSCCGHDKLKGTILLEDGRALVLIEEYEGSFQDYVDKNEGSITLRNKCNFKK